MLDDVIHLSIYPEGADVNEINRRGWTPLQMSAMKGQADIFSHLCHSGANAKRLTPNGHTIIELAQMFNNTSVMDVIQKHGIEASQHGVPTQQIHIDTIKRSDPLWVQQQVEHSSSQFIIWCKGKAVVIPSPGVTKSCQLLRASFHDLEPYIESDRSNVIYLGQWNSGCQESISLFAVNVSQEISFQGLNPNVSLLEPFPGFLELSASDATLFGHAVGLWSWHKISRFCSVCGHKTTITDAGYKSICSNDQCTTNKGVMYMYFSTSFFFPCCVCYNDALYIQV